MISACSGREAKCVEERSMRKFLVAAAMLGVAHGAQAADMPDFAPLRGAMVEGLSARSVNWQGYFIGGQAGYGSGDTKFGGSNSDLTGTIVANTLVGSET